jgi:hypothetical protein
VAHDPEECKGLAGKAEKRKASAGKPKDKSKAAKKVVKAQQAVVDSQDSSDSE